MRVILYFLLVYFCYCHDLHHADPVTVKQSEPTVTIDPLNKNIETTNVQTNHDTVEVHLQTTNDFKKPVQESHHQQQTTPSVDNSISIQKDSTSPSTPVQTQPKLTDLTNNIPTLNDKPNPKIIHHIPSPSNTIQNSNTIDLKSDQPAQVPLTKDRPTSTVQQQPQIHPRHVPITQQPNEDISKTETTTVQPFNDEQKRAFELSSNTKDTDVETNDENLNPILDQQNTSNVSTTKEDSDKKEIENSPTTVHSHLPRILENEEKTSINDSTNVNKTSDISVEDSHNSSTIPNNNDTLLTTKTRQICWRLPNSFEPSIKLLEYQIFRFINIFPEFLQTIVFGRIDDREILMNTIWFSSICTMCFLFSVLFLSMGAKRLKQSKHEKEIRARCQQLQQYNNQIELERGTFERQNQKLSDEIDELKTIPVRDADEDIFALREECIRFQEDLKTARFEKETLQQDIDYKQNLLQKYEFDLQRQVETVAYLNNENLRLKQELEKDRSTIARLQSNDLSLERFEKFQDIIQALKSEITQLKQDKFTQKDQLHEIQERTNQLDIENNQLTLRMKQLKTLLDQRDQTIKNIHSKINEDKTTEFEDLFPILSNENSQELLSTIDNDIEKSTKHIHNLHGEIDEKTRRIKELDLLLNQEKDRCREIETKLKVVLELRERDAHLHIRQLGQTDAELRKARTDTDRVRILQQQLELKQQQFDDVQKVLSTEQIKFNEECSKLQHETHEKWMEVKRLTRELETSKKECESLRRQITKYANSERSSQEKSMIRPVPQFVGNNADSETNGSSPISYQQGEKPIDHQRNDSGAGSPSEMFIPRPPLFGLPRPPFFPPQFMPPNPFMLHPRFPMQPGGPHGMISPIPHLITNGNDTNTSEMIDSPNSASYDTQLNGVGISPISDVKKPKKSLKKKTRTSKVKEDV